MCGLCKRDVPLTRHHVKLKRRDPSWVVLICAQCQQVVHGLYPGTMLARRPDLWTLEGLLADALIAKAVEHVKKIPPGSSMRMRQRRL